MSVCTLADVYTHVSMIYSNRDLKQTFGKCGAFGLPIQGQFISVSQLCPTLSFPVHHQLPELAQTAFNFSQHQGLFQ